jgi:hypothetical protein
VEELQTKEQKCETWHLGKRWNKEREIRVKWETKCLRMNVPGWRGLWKIGQEGLGERELLRLFMRLQKDSASAFQALCPQDLEQLALNNWEPVSSSTSLTDCQQDWGFISKPSFLFEAPYLWLLKETPSYPVWQGHEDQTKLCVIVRYISKHVLKWDNASVCYKHFN